MVNFKAGAHQGERKKRLAAQNAAQDQQKAIVKLEKLALLKRPWVENANQRTVVNQRGRALIVVAREKRTSHDSNATLKVAWVDKNTQIHFQSHAYQARAFICRPGGDYVLEPRAGADVGVGEIWLSEAQRISLRVCENEVYEWVPFDCRNTPNLDEITIEAQLVEALPDGLRPLDVDARELGLRLANRLFDSIVSDNEVFMVDLEEECVSGCVPSLALRVTEMWPRTIGGDSISDCSMLTSDALHCWRGCVTPQTKIRLIPSTRFKGSDASTTVAAGLKLDGLLPPRRKEQRDLVNVETEDGEIFPVAREILRPCIALTQAVRSVDNCPTATVPVGCLAFDRALLFLESIARGVSEDFLIEASAIDEMEATAKALGCRALAECVSRRKGDFQSRIDLHHWEDIVAHNDKGGCWVTMDNMVFDLEAWLPEHPGGATIIPAQALNVDSTVFFELYHASRESFSYLREFYIGEVWPDDRVLVPAGEEGGASADFMLQLQQFCAPWRLDAEVAMLAASAVHLGA